MADKVHVGGEGGSYLDHPFSPRLVSAAYERCEVCRLAEAAHSGAVAGYEPKAETYRCPWCVDTGAEVCPHGPKGALDMTGAIL